jgi:hypothetical protein
MPLFDVGDYVERLGPTVPEHMRFGRIVRIIPHNDLPEYLTEYAVDFGFVVANYHQSQLRLAEEPPPNT